jgi:Zn-dependent protease
VDHVLIAWAGVLAQLAVAIPILTIAAVFPNHDLGYLGPAIVFLGYVNLIFALVNLAPGAGLDGTTAWRVIPLLYARWKSRRVTKNAIRSWKRR